MRSPDSAQVLDVAEHTSPFLHSARDGLAMPSSSRHCLQTQEFGTQTRSDIIRRLFDA